MTLDQAREIIEEILFRYGIEHCESVEKRKDGKIHFVSCTIKFLIDGREQTPGPKKALTKK
jgi:hypothetical protein